MSNLETETYHKNRKSLPESYSKQLQLWHRQGRGRGIPTIVIIQQPIVVGGLDYNLS